MAELQQNQFNKSLDKVEAQQQMQSKYRKLYLYASNTQTISKKPSENYDEYKLKKERSIEHLKQLLDIKVGLPSVTSFLIFNRSKGEGQGEAKGREPRSFKILRARPKPSTLKESSGFLPPASPRAHPENPPQSKSPAKKQSQQDRQKAYQKYINEYMQKLQKQNLLQNYSQSDYKALVQEACKQIRRKMKEDQLQIKEVQNDMEESKETQLQSLKERKRKKIRGLDEVRRKEDSMEELGTHHQSFMSSMAQKILLRRNEHKKSKSVAENNLYKLNLQQVQKKNALKNKVRKRSQKEFVRHLSRHHSHLENLPHLHNE